MSLLAPIKVSEVCEAIFSMHSDKAPGPNGLNPTFFQICWTVVGDDVVQFC